MFSAAESAIMLYLALSRSRPASAEVPMEPVEPSMTIFFFFMFLDDMQYQLEVQVKNGRVKHGRVYAVKRAAVLQEDVG